MIGEDEDRCTHETPEDGRCLLRVRWIFSATERLCERHAGTDKGYVVSVPEEAGR